MTTQQYWAVVLPDSTLDDLFTSDITGVCVYPSRREAREHVADFKRWAAEQGVTLRPGDRLTVRPVRCVMGV